MRALTAAQAASELGRSTQWLHGHWRSLVQDGVIPMPVMEHGALTWNAAQFYAVLDKELTPRQRAHASAYRAALAAAFASPESVAIEDEIGASRARLDKKFGRTASSP